MAKVGYENYTAAVREAAAVDPMPTVQGLAKNAGLSPEEVAHYVLVQWATSFSEAHLAIGPLVLHQLREAADADDLDTIKGIISWLHSEL